MIRWLLLVLVGLSGFLSTGCSDSKYLYQSRYIPRPSELRWDSEHEQLWRPPAIESEDHIVRINVAPSRAFLLSFATQSTAIRISVC